MAPNSELQLSASDMRAMGYRVIDLIVDHLESLGDGTVGTVATPAQLDAHLWEPLPEHGRDPLDVLDRVWRHVLACTLHLDHPRFFGFVPSPGNFVGAMADALSAGFNVFAGTWLEASGPAMVELVTLEWLCRLCDLPARAGGLFVSGGSAANLTALIVARHRRFGAHHPAAVIYCSEQTHSSIDRAATALGFSADQLQRIATDDQCRLALPALHRRVAADRAGGRIPFCVIANAGTTNTGAVDPLPSLAEFCRREALWLHADGAYGAASVLCPRGRALLAGLGQVDSLSLDPHKWLFQPYEIGCLLMRDAEWLKNTFHVLPDYLHDAAGSEHEVNFYERGLQLTRSFRALKLWMSLQVFGRESFEAAVTRGFELAELAERTVRQLEDWYVVTPAQLGVVTFRCAPAGLSDADADALNESLVDPLIRTGTGMVNSTKLRGRTVLRLCPINPRTRDTDVRRTLTALDELSRKLRQRHGSGQARDATTNGQTGRR